MATRRPAGDLDRARPTGLIGRDAEAAVLARVLDVVAEGRAHTVLIEGEAGIGKTELADHLGRDAHGLGFQVLTGRADELEQRRALGAVLDAIAGGPADDALAVVREAATRGEPEEVLIEASLDAVERWAGERPLILILEDLHWADAATITAARTIARRLPYLPILIVGTFRPHPNPDPLRRLVDVASREKATLMTLAPLGDDESLALARSLLGADIGPSIATMLGTAAGNPLFVTELIASLDEEGLIVRGDGIVDATRPTLPANLRLTILRRLSFLPSPTLDVLRVASVLGGSFSLEELAGVTGSTSAQIVAALEPAIRSRVLGEQGGRARFRHDLIREAIYDDMAEPVRASTHLHAASILLQRGARPERLAAHLLRAPAEPTPGLLEMIEDVAQRLVSTMPKLALELAERAVEVAGDEPDRLDRFRIQMLWPLDARGRGAETVTLAEQLLTRPRDPATEITIKLASIRARQRMGRAAETVDELLAILDDPRYPAEQLRVARGALAGAYANTARPDQAGPLAEAVVAEARAAGDHDALGAGCYWAGIAAMMQGRSPDALRYMAEAFELDAQRRLQIVNGYLGYSIGLTQADRFAEARTVLNEGRRREQRAGGTSMLASMTSMFASLAFEEGAWDDAVAEAVTAVRLVEEEGGSAIAVFASYGVQAYVSLLRGDRAAADRAVDAGFSLLAERGPGATLDVLFWVKALCQMDAGDPDGALETAWTAWQLLEPARFAIAWSVFCPDLIRFLLAAGDTERASGVAAEAEEGARRAGGVASAEAAALRCRGLADDEPDLLVRAADILRAGPRRLEHVSCVEDAATALARHGRTAEARPLFDEALAFLEERGAARDVARITATMRGAGIRRGSKAKRARPVTGWGALTPSELAVARMAAEGLTNPQIAERLVVSKYTVMTHLQHVFAKLQISSRVELAARVARDDAGA